MLRAAWKTVVRTFAEMHPATVHPMARLHERVPHQREGLCREAQTIYASGRLWNGLRSGREGRKLAVDPRLAGLVGRAVGRDVRFAGSAQYLYYTGPGRLYWPHPDDPRFPVKVLYCVDRALPSDGGPASAFVAYRPNGSVERYELEPGSAIAVESVGLVHGREPLRDGERVTILSIQLRYASARAA